MLNNGAKRKKIVRIISRLNIGGPAIHTILISSELNKDGYEDVLVCGTVSRSEGDMRYLAEEKGVRPIVIPDLGREISLWRDIKAFIKLYFLIRKESPDIVHTHTAKAGTLGRMAAILAGVPVRVHTFHGHIFDGYFSPVKAKIFVMIERFLALFTDRVIVVSESVKKDIVARLKVTGGNKCSVIPLGLELDRFLDCEKKRGSFRKKFGVDSDTLLVGIVGRIVPIKNHKMFIDAAHNIKRRFPGMKIKFAIVGDGELKDSMIAYAGKLGMSNDIFFAGWIDDLAGVYADLDIMTLTSLNEGTPVSLIEAMASGRPVVATDVGGVKDLLGDNENGILADSCDVEGLSDKLASLAADKDRRNILGSSGRRAVLEKYSKARLINDLKKLYSDLTEKR